MVLPSSTLNMMHQQRIREDSSSSSSSADTVDRQMVAGNDGAYDRYACDGL